MQRELNPTIFGTAVSERKATSPNPEGPVDSSLMRAFEGQLSHLQARQKEVEIKQKDTEARVTEFINTSASKFDRLAKAIHRIEEYQRQMFEEYSQKLAGVGSKLSERRLSESKIEEMMDRHNQMVKTFEVRLQQMQKLISEKEMMLFGAHSALEDAKKELAKLKRL
jgi:hypothetical protein